MVNNRKLSILDYFSRPDFQKLSVSDAWQTQESNNVTFSPCATKSIKHPLKRKVCVLFFQVHDVLDL